MIDTDYFIHFGCWNNGGCPKDNDVSNVLEHIEQLTHKPQFLSICGDNYYPTVKKTKIGENIFKKKYLDIDNYISGLRCLPHNIPIYMTYGNHDFETELYIDENTIEKDCSLTKNEINIIDSQFHNIKLRLFQSVKFTSNTLLLFLDTTIYDEDINEYISCYKEVDNNYTSIDTIKANQIDFIEYTVDTIMNDNNISNIVIVCHHPLAYYKIKKGKMSFIMLNNEFNDLLYDKIHLPLRDRNINYYYLCADLHQYQPGNIIINGDMNIKQYIVGTAGASKDELNKTYLSTEHRIETNLEYFMNEEDIASATTENGYLICTNNKNNLVFEFIKTLTIGGNKTKKRKTRRNHKYKKHQKNKKNKKKQTKRKQK